MYCIDDSINVLREHPFLHENVCLFLIFWRAPFGYLYIYFFFIWGLNQDWVHQSILAWLWNYFHLVLDEIQTHDLLIESQVR